MEDKKIEIIVKHLSLENVDLGNQTRAYPLMFKAIQGHMPSIRALQQLDAYVDIVRVTVTSGQTDIKQALQYAYQITTRNLPVIPQNGLYQPDQSTIQAKIERLTTAHQSRISSSSGIGTLLVCNGKTYVCLTDGIQELKPDNIRLLSKPDKSSCKSTQHGEKSMVLVQKRRQG